MQRWATIGTGDMSHRVASDLVAWSGVDFLDLSATISGEIGWIRLKPMIWAGTRARIHAGSVQRIFVEPELIEHPREGNGYQPMLGGVLSALEDGVLEHPRHERHDTVRIAQTMDAVLAEISVTTAGERSA